LRIAPVNHEQAFGRIAFSCPTAELSGIQEAIKKADQKILTPLVSLDTPGKATVHVVILADPNMKWDGHEICFVGDEAFRELSQVDPKGESLLKEALIADKSDEWFAKKGLSKEEKERYSKDNILSLDCMVIPKKTLPDKPIAPITPFLH
ncbi:glyoxalase domain-containing protein 4, partial [Caerostris extrusa]